MSEGMRYALYITVTVLATLALANWAQGYEGSELGKLISKQFCEMMGSACSR